MLTHRFLAWRALAAGANLRDRRGRMVDLAPVLGLAAALELHRRDVGTGDDEVAFDEPHGERGHRAARPFAQAHAAMRHPSASLRSATVKTAPVCVTGWPRSLNVIVAGTTT